MKKIRRGGAYFRVAGPDWGDPLDGTYSMKSGGRWNAPGSFPVVYLNATVELARAQVAHKCRGGPWSPEDLDPGPVLVSTDVPWADYLDVVTDEGCSAVGLPRDYPAGVGHEDCQPIGQAAWDAGLAGVACRSAAVRAPEGAEELAWFQRSGERLPVVSMRDFEDWY